MPSIQYNALIDSHAARTWRLLKQFGAISQWHPAIRESTIEDGQHEGLVGCIRRLTLQDGAVLRERLLSLDEEQLRLSYRFEEAPLPVDDYVMTIKLIPLSGQARTLVQWAASFTLRSPERRADQIDEIRGLIVGGHESLGHYLARPSAS